MSIHEVLADIDRVRNGEFPPIVPLGFERLDEVIFMTQRMYHLIGGAGGTGKSSFVDTGYILKPYRWWRRNKDRTDTRFNVTLFSMERSRKYRMAKWICQALYQKNGKVVSVKQLMGWNYRHAYMPEELYRLVYDLQGFFDQMQENVQVLDGAADPDAIYKYMHSKAMRMGALYQFETDELARLIKVKIHQGRKEVIPTHVGPSFRESEKRYVPDDPRQIETFIVDHIQKVKLLPGKNEKQTLDAMSHYAGELRDVYGQSPVMVSQFNRGIADIHRRTKTELAPQDSDFAGSSNMFNDADAVMAVFYPDKYQISESNGYKIAQFTGVTRANRFRALYVLKSTYGEDNLIFPFLFIGENGLFEELPRVEKMSAEYMRFIQNLSSSYVANRTSSPDEPLAQHPGDLFQAQDGENHFGLQASP